MLTAEQRLEELAAQLADANKRIERLSAAIQEGERRRQIVKEFLEDLDLNLPADVWPANLRFDYQNALRCVKPVAL